MLKLIASPVPLRLAQSETGKIRPAFGKHTLIALSMILKIRLAFGKASTYRSKHDSENKPPIAPDDYAGGGSVLGQAGERPERAEEYCQKSCFQKLRFPSYNESNRVHITFAAGFP